MWKSLIYIKKIERKKKGVDEVILGQKWPKIILYDEQREVGDKKYFLEKLGPA
jgi:hypothetical protein